MPIRTVPGQEARYFLLCFDKDGLEQREHDGTLLSGQVLQAVKSHPPPTDVIIISHGWMGDVDAAIAQYDRWIAAFTAVHGDAAAATQRDPNFRPLVVGLHWPSLPWGDETIPEAGSMLLGAAAPDGAREVSLWAERIADTPAATDALAIILGEATKSPADALSPRVREAYQRLFVESGLQFGDERGRPGADQEGFDVDQIIADSPRFSAPSATSGPGVLGSSAWRDARDLLLAPLRTLSFWKMKDRARAFGETAAHDLLLDLQHAAPDCRFHLMGHSFGCIVVSGAVLGNAPSAKLSRPVETLFLAQGALSLWAFAQNNPYVDGRTGYFRRLIEEDLVLGPILTTMSRFDTAVGRYYPIGARLAGQYVLSAEYPKYGGIGTYGIQGSPDTWALPIGGVDAKYGFRPSGIYNIDASRVIRNGSGTLGAHSDIAHPEVAHLFWSGILTTFKLDNLGGGNGDSGGPDHPLLSDTPGISEIPSLDPLSRGFDIFQSVHRGGGLLSADDDSAPVPESVPASPSIALDFPEPDIEPDPRAAFAHVPHTSPGSAGSIGGGGGGAPPAPAPPLPASVGVQDTRAAFNAAPTRYVTAEIEDREPTKPLQPGHWYTLSFGVRLQAGDRSISVVPLADIPFAPGEDGVLVSIQLDSADFSIATKTLPLYIEKTGASKAPASFGISPLRTGKAVIKASIHKDANFIQEIELTFDIAAAAPMAVQTVGRGRPITSADTLRPRAVSLIIEPRDGYYECRVMGSVSTRARLVISEDYLASEIKIARRALLDVVQSKKGALYPFQIGVHIEKEQSDAALASLAQAGARLFRKIFFGPDAGADSIALGECLKRILLENEEILNIQISAEKLPVPWGLLYLDKGDGTDPKAWNRFVGFRHIVEQIPLQNNDPVSTPIIASSPSLALGTQLNRNIDTQFKVSLVADQIKFWSDPKIADSGVHVTQRSSRQEVIQALCDASLPDQILYFYCHAVSYDLGDKYDPGASKLTFEDGEVTLDQLQAGAPITRRFTGRPLVFINACESAELSALFYDGFVPYFVARGARGVVGTECSMPALFAADWAREFFKAFLGGGLLGLVIFNLRNYYLREHGNPLGLLYAVYCDPNTQVQPGLALGA